MSFLSFRLSDDFLAGYKDKKAPFGYTDAAGNSVGEITFLRTYSRLKDDGCKESWVDVCERVINGMYSIQKDHCKSQRLPWNDAKAQASAKEAFDRLFNLKWTPPGRGLWVMGTPLVNQHKNSAALQNCAFVSTAEMTKQNPSRPFAFLMEASMLGVGVGFDDKGADKEFTIYAPTQGDIYVIPDTREGWVESVSALINSYLRPDTKSPVFDYKEIRPAGTPIKTFGGTAAGSEPLERLHNHIHNKFKGRAGEKLTRVDIADIGNLIGVCVVSGNVRRSAELLIGRIDDDNFLNLKNAERYPERNSYDPAAPGWGWMSNNSVETEVGKDLTPIVEGIARNGEPGVVWLDVSRKFGRLADPANNKDHRVAGYNPCITGDTKILLADGRGAVSIQELAEAGDDVEVFTIDQKGNVVIRDMRAPRKTGDNLPVLKVTFDDGSSFRATPNHKLVLKDGSEVRVDELKAGDSITAVTRSQRKMHEIWGPKSTASTSQFYWWMTEPKKAGAFRAEHRIVAEHVTGAKIPTGHIVHHADVNALNNAPSNLFVMSKEDHDELHASMMRGDNNPMRKEYSPEWWERYKRNLSIATSGENNPRYSGWSHDEIREIALEITKKLQRVPTINEFKDACKEKNAPSLFTKWRAKHLNGGISGLLRWASNELGYTTPETNDPRTLRYLQNMLKQGYDARIVDGNVKFFKRCEYCDTEFVTPVRETGFCSHSCMNYSVFTKGSAAAIERGRSVALTYEDKHVKIRKKQVDVYLSLKTKLGANPMRKEWASACKSIGVSAEIGRSSSPFTSWSDLQDAAAGFNHKVVSVVSDGFADVYNGTVDDTHRYLIAAGKGVRETGGFFETYVLSPQCGEQSLESYECCTLVETYLNRHKDLEDYKRTLKFAYLYAKTVTLLPTHWEETNAIMQRNRRIGTSMSGVANFADRVGLPELREWMDEGYKIVKTYDVTYSEWLGIRESIKMTTIKPSGTVSILAGESPGVHWTVGGEYFDRAIRFANSDPMLPLFKMANYRVEPASESPDTTSVVFFPIKSGAKRSEKDVSIFEKISLAATAQRYWSDNSVSVTVSFDMEKESDYVGTVLHMYDGQLKTVSFLPQGNFVYPQMPYTQITAEQYEEATMKLFPIDFSGVYAGLAADAIGEAYCTTDACEIKLIKDNQ